MLTDSYLGGNELGEIDVTRENLESELGNFKGSEDIQEYSSISHFPKTIYAA